MKKNFTIITLFILFIILSSSLEAQQGFNRGSKGKNSQYAKREIHNPDHLFVSTNPLLDFEILSLKKMKEEEKLAHDVYLFFYEKYKLPAFKNIAESESKHIDAIASLMKFYNLKNYSKKNRGEFADPELLALYQELISKSNSLTEALETASLIEDLDIYDLNETIKKSSNQNIKLVYTNLKEGSENHLRAFTSQLFSQGKEYSPKYISQDYYQEIINSEIQKGRDKNDVEERKPHFNDGRGHQRR